MFRPQEVLQQWNVLYCTVLYCTLAAPLSQNNTSIAKCFSCEGYTTCSAVYAYKVDMKRDTLHNTSNICRQCCGQSNSEKIMFWITMYNHWSIKYIWERIQISIPNTMLRMRRGMDTLSLTKSNFVKLISTFLAESKDVFQTRIT